MTSKRYWTDELIVKEIQRVMDKLNLTDRMPSVTELREHSTCYYAINKYGGMERFSKLLRLPIARDVILYKKTCVVCGREFTSRYRHTRCCSQRCRNKTCTPRERKKAVKKQDIRSMQDVRKSRAFEIEAEARRENLSYADRQKFDSIEKFARVDIN